MIRGFSTKKIKAEKTLGETFKARRKHLNISLSDAEIGSKVRMKYLEALEESQWQSLPQGVYTRGFVLAYAKFLNLDKDQILKLYETEAKINLRENNNQISYNQTYKEKKVLLTPKILAYVSLCSFVLFLLSYIAYQVVHFAGKPNLEILSPNDKAIVSVDTVNLTGITDTNTSVSINDQTISVSSDGRFISKVRLHSGVNTIKIKAINKIKKETTRVYMIEYKPETAFSDSGSNEN